MKNSAILLTWVVLLFGIHMLALATDNMGLLPVNRDGFETGDWRNFRPHYAGNATDWIRPNFSINQTDPIDGDFSLQWSSDEIHHHWFMLSNAFYLAKPNPEQDYYFDKPDDGVIRILTYNIRNCIGMDGKTDFGRIADVINRINPHIVALQEVDSVTYRMNGIDVLGLLAEKTNMFPSYGPAIDFQGGKYGNGVLSREKPLSFEYIPLPGRQERRSLLMVEFEDYIFYCTHLNNAFTGDRHGSVLIIDYEARNAKKPIFLAGDINDTPGSRTLELLSENWIQLSDNEFTFRSDAPEKCIDYIFGLKHDDFSYEIIRQVVVNEPVASDHLPVFVDVRIRAQLMRVYPRK